MLEILKILASKTNGRASLVLSTMILMYLLGTAAVVNHFFVCIGLIFSLCVLFLLVSCFSKKDKKEKEEEKKK